MLLVMDAPPALLRLAARFDSRQEHVNKTLQNYLWSEEYFEWRRAQGVNSFHHGKGIFAELKNPAGEYCGSTACGVRCEEEFRVFGLTAQFLPGWH